MLRGKKNIKRYLNKSKTMDVILVILGLIVLGLGFVAMFYQTKYFKAKNDLDFWRNEAIRLDKEKPMRGKDGRFAKKSK